MKGIIRIFIGIVFFVVRVPVCFASSTDIHEDSVIYAECDFFDDTGKISTISLGDISCRCAVVNNTDKVSEVSVILGLYHDDILVEIKSSTEILDTGEDFVFDNCISVPGDSGYTIKVYVTAGLNNAWPVRRVITLSDKSNAAELLAFSLNGYMGEINKEAKRVNVTVPYGESVDYCITEAIVSNGAVFISDDTDFSNPVDIEVEAENGCKSIYTVYVDIELPRSNTYEEGFDLYELGQSPDGWRFSKNNGGAASVEYDPDDAENKVLKLDDVATDGYINMYYDFDEVFAPCEVSFRVRYDRTDEYSAQNDISYCWVNFGNGSSAIGGMSAKDSASRQTFVYKSTAEREYKDKQLRINDWINIRMIYNTDGTVDYYADGDFVINVPAANERSGVSRISAQTTQARMGTLYLDDIKVYHIVIEEEPDFFECFEDGYNEQVISVNGHSSVQSGEAYADGNVLMLYDASVSISAKDRACMFAFDCFSKETATVRLGNEFLLSLDGREDAKQRIEIYCEYDEDYKKNFYTAYADGRILKKCVCGEDSVISDIKLFMNGISWIDNIEIK